MPREASPCGMVIERQEVLLFSQPECRFPALCGVEPRVLESLLAPFSLNGKPIGTVWAIAHSPERKFDGEDARVLASLARVASAAHQMVRALEAETRWRGRFVPCLTARARGCWRSPAGVRKRTSAARWKRASTST